MHSFLAGPAIEKAATKLGIDKAKVVPYGEEMGGVRDCQRIDMFVVC